MSPEVSAQVAKGRSWSRSTVSPLGASGTPGLDHALVASSHTAPRATLRLSEQRQVATAIVYCEANFGAIDGKTANDEGLYTLTITLNQ